MDAYKAVVGKRDTRAFSDKPVDEPVLHRILQAGRMAGSAKMLEPCRFVVLTDLKDKQALAACGQFSAWIPGAPVNIAIVIPEDGRDFDGGRSAQNMMIVAHAEGLASCPVTMHDPDATRRTLGLPDDRRVAIVLAIGHPAAGGRMRMSRGRKPMDEYVHYGRWRA